MFAHMSALVAKGKTLVQTPESISGDSWSLSNAAGDSCTEASFAQFPIARRSLGIGSRLATEQANGKLTVCCWILPVRDQSLDESTHAIGSLTCGVSTQAEPPADPVTSLLSQVVKLIAVGVTRATTLALYLCHHGMS